MGEDRVLFRPQQRPAGNQLRNVERTSDRMLKLFENSVQFLFEVFGK